MQSFKNYIYCGELKKIYRLKRWNVICILVILFSCKNDNITGNFSICYNDEYTEVYFKKDSMRIASDNDWVKLSEWSKIEIKNDTLLFQKFGEWKDFSKAKIEYTKGSRIKMWILETDEILILEPIYEDLNFEEPKEFWKGFYIRQNLKNCK